MSGGNSSSDEVFPNDFERTLAFRHAVTTHIRSFFNSRDYLEVETPLRVRCPAVDAYIDCVPAGTGFFLASSPELHMKRLLTRGLPRLYQITHAFRAEEEGRLHCCEFTMLEWYRTGTDYLGILQETEQLIESLVKTVAGARRLEGPFERLDVSDVYLRCAGWDPCADWDEDRYYRDWVDLVEPEVAAMPAVVLLDYPAATASLARLKPDCPTKCERFELFVDGVEIGNAFSELQSPDEHRQRFADTARRRTDMGKQPYVLDERFMDDLRSGMPECGGIAVGLDRLVMVLLGMRDIRDVVMFSGGRL